MESYIQRIVEAVGDIGPPVLLVGHSMGGLPISEAAERIPSRISKLIYLTAVLPQSGEKLTDFTEVNEGESSAALALIDSAEEGAHEFDPAMAADIFYSLCTPERVRRAIARLKPQADAPLAEPVHMTVAGWGSLSKTYIICTEDRAHPVSRQHWYCDRMPNVKKILLKADHSPFYSKPIELTQLICAEASWKQN
jgi:pimeloyl-ACP methyl ester carboxylesterase